MNGAIPSAAQADQARAAQDELCDLVANMTQRGFDVRCILAGFGSGIVATIEGAGDGLPSAPQWFAKMALVTRDQGRRRAMGR